jgi:hypothetical protein
MRKSTTMKNRFDDALFAQTGACNGRAVSHALVAAYAAAHTESRDTATSNNDPAVRLLLHQLCHLAGIPTMDSGNPDGFDYARDTALCEARQIGA